MDGGFEASGRLVSREEVAIAPELSGYRVSRVAVEEGDHVRQGEVLAVLDDTLLRSQIAQARASLDQQRISYEKARLEAARVAQLDDKGVLSQEAITERRIAERSTRAAVAASRAQLEDLLVRQKRLVVRSPVAGRVLERQARPGEPSASGSVLFTIARDNLVELLAEVPEREMQSLSIGDPVEVTLASGARINGKVRLLGARVNDRTGLSTVRIALPTRDDLRPGGFAKAQFAQGGASALTVPEAAVHYDADGAYMLIVDESGHAHRTDVKTGRRAGGRVEIVSGASAGMNAILSGAAFLLEGDKVRTVTEARR